MEHTGYKEHYKEQIITMKILVYLTFRESPLRLYYHDNHTGYTTETTTSWLQTNQNSTSDYDRRFSNQCDRCKMLKVVHGNRLNNHCHRWDTWPSILLTTRAVFANTQLP